MPIRHYHLRTLAQVPGMAAHLAGFFADRPSAMTGLFELLVNAVEHGNLALGFARKTELLAAGRWAEELRARQADPRYAHRRVFIVLRHEDGWSEVRITDEGGGFDWAGFIGNAAMHDHSHGRGLCIAQRSGFDALEFNGAGNSVACRGAPVGRRFAA